MKAILVYHAACDNKTVLLYNNYLDVSNLIVFSNRLYFLLLTTIFEHITLYFGFYFLAQLLLKTVTSTGGLHESGAIAP